MIKPLYEQYQELLIQRKNNRKTANDLIKKNQTLKKTFIDTKSELINTITRRMNEGETLYHICLTDFGIVDGRFNILYSMLVSKWKQNST